MKVKELIDLLSKVEDKEKLVVMSQGEEGNRFQLLYEINTEKKVLIELKEILT